MNGIVFGVGLIWFSPVLLDQDVLEVNTRDFIMPVSMSEQWREKCEKFRLWVSNDHGKSWKRYAEIPATGTRFVVSVPKDGAYWMILQILTKDGELNPSKVSALEVQQKMFVNVGGNVLIRKHGSAVPFEIGDTRELRKEVEQLRIVVEQLQKRIVDIEKKLVPK